MLQLGGIMTSAGLRLHPRVSWSAAAQQLLFASSAAPESKPNLQQTETAVKDKGPAKQISKDQVTRKFANPRRPTISNVFTSIMNSKNAGFKSDSELQNAMLFDEKLKLAKNVAEVMELVDKPIFPDESAMTAVSALFRFVSKGEAASADFETDIRYTKLQDILGRANKFKRDRRLARTPISFEEKTLGYFQTEQTAEKIRSMPTSEVLRSLSLLSLQKKRTVPVLEAIASQLAATTQNFTIKQSADIFYHLSVLNYPHDGLLMRCCNDFIKFIPECKNSAMVGSILKSLGMLKFRNEKLLKVLCEWVAKKPVNLRPQDISSFLLTLATLGYCPNNYDELYKEVIGPLKESDMIESGHWLDVVWSLTVLNKATPEHFKSVLNESFQDRIFDISDIKSSKEQKLLNINGAAELTLNYKEPLLANSSPIFNVGLVRSKEKYKLVNSALGALKVLLPTANLYLNVNINTKMGFLLDAEFCVDEKCNRVPVDFTSEIAEKNVFRIGVITSDYHDYTRGSVKLLGIVQLYIRLLELKGYNILHLPYTEFRMDDKLIDRVKYINEKIKTIVNNSPAQRSKG